LQAEIDSTVPFFWDGTGVRKVVKELINLASGINQTDKNVALQRFFTLLFVGLIVPEGRSKPKSRKTEYI